MSFRRAREGAAGIYTDMYLVMQALSKDDLQTLATTPWVLCATGLRVPGEVALKTKYGDLSPALESPLCPPRFRTHPVMCLQRPHQVCNAARRPQRVLMPEAEKYATQQYILYTTSHQHGLHKRLAVTRGSFDDDPLPLQQPVLVSPAFAMRLQVEGAS